MSNTTLSPRTTRRRKRRWFQFSLRTLLIGVLVAGFGIGGFCLKLERARREAAVVDGILDAGGRVYYDFEFDSEGNYVADAAPNGSAWLHGLLGIDFFRSVHTVYPVSPLSEPAHPDAPNPVTEAELDRLSNLPRLNTLVLTGVLLSDDLLEHVAGLTQVRELWLNDTQVTDAGLEYLGRLTDLNELSLTATQVTGAGLDHLRGLTHLRKLHLDNTRINDAALEHVAGLTQLTELSLEQTLVSEAGLRKLRQTLPNCAISGSCRGKDDP